jgi:hypothetical protein
MDREAIAAWSKTFLARATQLCTPQLGAEWIRAGVSAEDAAAWANAGFLPSEAAPLIADGITPQMHAEMEAHAEEQAGGPEALAAVRIAELLGSGALLGPDDVIVVEDPEDPRRQIIAVRDDLG